MSDHVFSPVEIISVPFHKELYGVSMPVEPGQKPGEVMFKAMDETWKLVRANKLQTKGINHILYTENSSVFAGVEVVGEPLIPPGLQWLDVEFPRYAYYRHVGGYDLLPAVYQAINQEIAAKHETPSGESMEIYGHATDDPNQQVTEILIGLD